jgi:peptidoglycan biosynthesis protein MviN/MurJ (putative lipid II flippase)
MSTQTLTLDAATRAQTDAAARPELAGAQAHGSGSPLAADAQVDAGTRKARAGMAMSIATFAMAAASAIQAVLYLGKFGTNGRTDGFFVAFALYSTFGVFSQSLRVTSVPLLVEPGARLSPGRFAATLGLVAVPVLLLTGPLASPLAQLIAPGLGPHGRAITADALPVLGCAMVLQLWAAGGATVLAVRDRFTTIAGAYMSGALAGLIAFVALMSTAGVQTLGWSMLTMSIVTCAWMLVGVRRSGGFGRTARHAGGEAVRDAATDARSHSVTSETAARGGLFAPGGLVRDCGVVLGRTAIYLAFNVLFVITLAFGSRSAAGGTTVLSYAYLFVSYLVAGTGMALGMSSIPDLTRDARAQQRTLVAAAVPRGFRYAMLIAAPALAVLIVAGASLVHAVLPHSLSAAEAHTLRSFAALLAPWLIAALIINFLLPVLLALGRARLLGALALPLVLLQLAATALGSALFGVNGAVGAFWVAPSCLATVLLVAAVGRSGAGALVRELARDGLRFLVLAALAFGAGWAAGAALPAPELVQAAVAGLIGCTAYLAGLWFLARPQLEVLVGALVTRPATA